MKNYRLKIISDYCCSSTTFLVRRNESVSYISANETPLALSNLVSNKAAQLRFDLQDAVDGNAAAKLVREVLREQWKRNITKCPIVEVLQ